MKQIAMLVIVILAFPLILSPQGSPDRDACYQACILEKPNAELRRQEVIALEKEAARAIQNKDATFFRRVYSDDFRGTLSHGQPVSKASFVELVQSSTATYEAVTVSDININFYRDTAVVTSLWSLRSSSRGERASSQLRMIHVYVYGSSGFHLVLSQSTPLPPFGPELF
jgi:ketosteroid isomerase-like protein